MFIDLFDKINKKFGHNFISYHPGVMVDVYICDNCNNLYFTHYFNKKENFDGGVAMNDISYEFYNSFDEDDFDYINYLDLMKCEEKQIKNLLE